MHCDSSLPLVSVLMPVYNAGDFLRPAILSILNQTYSNIELIIIDDGSTDTGIDSNQDLIKSDNRIRYIRQENTGRPGALNRGLGMMCGAFWMIEDADDISHPQRIEKQLSVLLADSQLAAVFCKNDIILPDGRTFAPGCKGFNSSECKALIDHGTVPAHDATGLYRSERTSGYFFDEDMWLIEGVDFVIRIGENFPIAVVADCLYSHRVNYGSVTHSQADKIFAATEKFKTKMVQRRGGRALSRKQRSTKRAKSTFKHRRYDTVLPYAMSSVVEQRRCGNWQVAFETAKICLHLHPFDWLYYKPMVYCFTPLFLIDLYRSTKKPGEVFEIYNEK